MNLPNFFAELQRRHVYKVGAAYAVAGWLVVQIVTQVFPIFEVSALAQRLIVLVIVAGFPVTLILTWLFDITPKGIVRTDDLPATGESHAMQRERVGMDRKMNYVLALLLVTAIGYFVLDRTLLRRDSVQATGNAKSIAVLPFESLSEDKANAYFADGIQDEILARLSKIADLKVISRTSTQKYKSAPTNLREIAQQLGVGNVLEGTVQKAADQVRVTVQLINAVNDSHLWTETYDRKLVDLFQVESEISEKVAGSLEARLTGREKQDIAVVGTTNPQAYDAYLHALALSRAQSQENVEKFLALSRRAIELDPNYMEAWALLAIAESQHYLFANHTEMQLAKVREAAERAIKLGPDASEAHRAMGSFYYCLRDYDRALVELNLAKERAPNVADTQFYIGLVQRRQGEVERCIASMLAASKLDPLNEDIWVNLGRTYRGTRRFGEARAMFDRALATAPNDAEVIAQKAETFVAEGDLATAWSMIKDIEFGPLERGLDLSAAMLIYQRRFDEAARLFSETLATRQNGPQLFEAVRQTLLGDVYQLKGERDKAQPLFAQAAETLKLLRSEGDDGFLLLDALVGATANLNDRSEVARTAGAIQERIAKDKWGFLRDEEAIARAYTTLGDFDRALPLLQHALSAPGAESLTPALLRFDPFWDPIRNDPRFQKLAGGKQ